MGAALIGSDDTQAIPYLLDLTQRRPYLAIAHYYLGVAMHRGIIISQKTVADEHTTWKAEIKKAAQQGSGEVKTRAEAILKLWR